jgi:hypothetical protein
VFRDGEYAGEAMLDTMRPGEERLVPFSVELGCNITTAFDTTAEAEQTVGAGSGYIYHTTWTRRRTTYTIRNNTKRKLKIFLDHPADRGAEYVDTPKPRERTETFDRFVIESEPGKQLEFKVVERRQHTSSMWFAPEQIANHLHLASVAGAKALLKQLEPLAAIAKQIADAADETNKINHEMNEITQQHARIRGNLDSLKDRESKKERDLRERYVGQLDADETRLEKLRTRRTQLEKQVKDLREQFSAQAAKVKG